MSNPPTLDAFKDAFQNDPARREKEREYQQRRSSQKRTTRKSSKKRTEKDRAYEREYARKRREMTLHIRRNRKNVRRRGDRRTRIMIRIGMRLIRNTRRVGRRRVGTGMRMILRIGRWRSNGGGNLHRIIRSIGRSGGCICKSIVGGRRRRRGGIVGSLEFGQIYRKFGSAEVGVV